jgi:cellulose biosynthesis protein BcsQ
VIITFASQKGGVGKSSLVCLSALYWAEKGKQVAIRDLDSQESAQAFLVHIEHPMIKEYDEAQDADYVLIDTPGGITDRDLRNLLEFSDLVIIPFCLGPADMRTTEITVRRIHAHEKARLLFNRVNTSTAIFKDRRNYASILGIPAFKNFLGDRVAYRYALIDGWSSLNKKAKDELVALIEEIEKEGENG